MVLVCVYAQAVFIHSVTFVYTPMSTYVRLCICGSNTYVTFVY